MSNKKNHRRKNRTRKPYTKSKAGDTSCRNHGSCKYCVNGRLYTNKRRKAESNED